ncbi:hypothetical protein LK433_04470 [Segatella copri DSM 18205]|nr:hypothetical protein LK433_04470 [Segatella copri DSM 18205]
MPYKNYRQHSSSAHQSTHQHFHHRILMFHRLFGIRIFFAYYLLQLLVKIWQRICFAYHSLFYGNQVLEVIL